MSIEKKYSSQGIVEHKFDNWHCTVYNFNGTLSDVIKFAKDYFSGLERNGSYESRIERSVIITDPNGQTLVTVHSAAGICLLTAGVKLEPNNGTEGTQDDTKNV